VLVGLTNDPASSEVINLTVSDTGIGIAKENLPRLFSVRILIIIDVCVCVRASHPL
jgi:DNA topoisomerase VI subunit B